MKPEEFVTRAEVTEMMKRAIVAHEIKFSAFGVLTALLALVLGFVLTKLI